MQERSYSILTLRLEGARAANKHENMEGYAVLLYLPSRPNS